MMSLGWVLLFPLLGAVLGGFFLPRHHRKFSAFFATGCVLASFISAIFTFFDMMSSEKNQIILKVFDWITVADLNIPFEFMVDRLSGVLMLVITGVGTFIHMYAAEYLHDEKTLYRFYAYLNFFVFMMLLLVLGHNLLVMFVGWEGVGLCSYLLIGYWFEDMNNAKAGSKAFIVNRIGDIGFLLGVFLTFKTFHTLTFTDLHITMHALDQIHQDLISQIGWITLCFFVAACGKSAQMPLYVWLPDAMAGPTPVSALIHAATMVTAGIYMMTRLNFFYFFAPNTLVCVAFVGALTAFFAATIAMVQTDIKKVLAYSTVSQLGFMVLACGVGAFDAGVFHLLTHACFKALLFLGAGSVIYAMHHEQDMFKMGDLKTYMPVTSIAMFIGVLAIIGFPGFSGFFSKDEILWRTFIFPRYGMFLWLLAFLAAVCTSFYMVRLFCLTFLGECRADKHTRSHLHESPLSMTLPLMVLSFLSVTVGYLGVPNVMADLFGGKNLFSSYLSPLLIQPKASLNFWTHHMEVHSHALEWFLMTLTVFTMLVSSYVAIYMYNGKNFEKAKKWSVAFPRIYNTLLHKYRVDEYYHHIFVENLSYIGFFLWKIVDVVLIQGLVLGCGRFFYILAHVVSFRMTGSVQSYAVIFTAFLAIFLFALMG